MRPGGQVVIVGFQDYCRNIMIETASALGGLTERLEHVRRKIGLCARRCNRAAEEITLVAITKTHPIRTLRSALSLGMHEFGENRVQEAETKIEELGRASARWHLVGHLQANKARRAVRLFDVIHSLDSISLAHRLDRFCGEENRADLPVLIQVDLAQETTKSGASEAELLELAKKLDKCSHLRLMGLMTLPPFFENVERVRPFFRRLRELRDQLQTEGCFGAESGALSMGMSHDYEIAIEEGATMLRIGTAIFGERGAGAG